MLAGCGLVTDSIDSNQHSQVQPSASETTESLESNRYEVTGFTSIDEEWAYKFSSPQACTEGSGACITLSLQTLKPCERAEIGYRLESVRGEFKFLQEEISMSNKSDFSSANEILSWKDPAWERVRLESLRCISPEIGDMAVATGNLAPELVVNSEFPEDYWPVSARMAFQWKDTTPCKDFYDTCWSMFVFSATNCAAVYASFEIQDKAGKVLDSQVLATRNVAVPAKTPTAVQFGTSSRIDSQQLEKLRVIVDSVNCLDAPIDGEGDYASAISRVDLPKEFCYLGNCNPFEEAAQESELSRILEYLQQFPVNPSGSSGFRVRCNDGTYSNAGGRQGACSWHGGVSG